MRKIKFRGKSLYSNKIFYGGYYEDHSGAEFIVQPNGEMNRVESVVQLIGYDKNGTEIYEGDEIKSRFGSSRYANFCHFGGIIDGAYTFVQTRIIN